MDIVRLSCLDREDVQGGFAQFCEDICDKPTCKDCPAPELRDFLINMIEPMEGED